MKRMPRLKKIRFALTLTAVLALVILGTGGRLADNRLEESRLPAPETLPLVGFDCREQEPGEAELRVMVNTVVTQILGPEGWRALCKPGDRVVIKVNLVGPHRGAAREKGKAIITDPRLVKIAAEEVRAVIGWEAPAELIVTDALFYKSDNPSLKGEITSFYRSGYDDDGDGILDGGSGARLVNCDSYGRDRRYLTEVAEPVLGTVPVWLPEFLHPDRCDVLIGLPVFKSHGFTGVTGGLKISYGFRSLFPAPGDGGRLNHSGYGWGTGNKQLLLDYLCALYKALPYDFLLMDALTANRKGPLNLNESDFGAATDWFPVHALMAATDPVALDTAEALLGGYDPESVKLLFNAAADGIGENRPEYIRIAGGERFGRHKRFLAETRQPKRGRAGKAFGTWPFHDKWGGARILPDIEPPAVTLGPEERNAEGLWTFSFAVRDAGNPSTGIARIDLMVDGVPVSSLYRPPEEGFITADLSRFRGRPIECRLLVWDNTLNATLSEPFQPVNP